MERIVDLTYSLKEGMLTFGAYWHPAVSIKPLGRIESEGRVTHSLSFGTHTGTHIDAPLHFVKQGTDVSNIPLDLLIGPVTIADFSGLKENQKITAEMLQNINISQRMIFKFGWGRHWNTQKFYRGYPFFSAQAAEYLIAQKVSLIAMDTPSPDDSRIELKPGVIGTEVDSPMHKMFLKNGVFLVEYLANLDDVGDYEGWNIVVMPLKIKNADGAPARVCIYR